MRWARRPAANVSLPCADRLDKAPRATDRKPAAIIAGVVTNRGDQSLVTLDGAIDTGKEGQAFLHCLG